MLNFALSLLLVPLFAAEPAAPLKLDAAVATALGNNPELKKRELEADSASWSRLEALSDHLPHLEAEGSYLTDAKYTRLNIKFGAGTVEFPAGFPQADIQLKASIMLFDGFAAINRYRAAGLFHDAAELEYRHAKFRLAEFIRIRFYQALAAQNLAKVAIQNIETLEQHLRLAEASKRAGFSTNVDVLRIESQLEEARSERILADDNIFIARHALNEAMGVDDNESPLEGELPQPDGKSLPSGMKLDVSARDDLQADSRREQAQDRLNTAAAGFWFPKISFFAYEQFYKFGSFDPDILPSPSFQNSYSVGLRLSWNLFDGGASIARKGKADDAAKIVAEGTRKLQLASPNEFETWKRRYIYNSALFHARKRSVEKSAESVRLATISVKAGTKTHSETLDAELELFRARAGVIRAQVDAVEALANLELALGHTL